MSEPSQTGWQAPPPPLAVPIAPPPPAPATNSLAVAAVICGALLMWPLALIFGYTSRRQIDESNGQETGRNLAVAGIWLGWAVLAAIVLFILGYAVFGGD